MRVFYTGAILATAIFTTPATAATLDVTFIGDFTDVRDTSGAFNVGSTIEINFILDTLSPISNNSYPQYYDNALSNISIKIDGTNIDTAKAANFVDEQRVTTQFNNVGFLIGIDHASLGIVPPTPTSWANISFEIGQLSSFLVGLSTLDPDDFQNTGPASGFFGDFRVAFNGTGNFGVATSWNVDWLDRPISPVPLPASLGFGLFGLAALAGLRTRQRKNRQPLPFTLL